MNPKTVLLTIDQAAALGRVPAETLRYWIKQGRLEVVRNGRRVFIMRGTLENILVTVCPACGERFRRPTMRARFCSTKCRKRAHRAKDIKIQAGKETGRAIQTGGLSSCDKPPETPHNTRSAIAKAAGTKGDA